MAGESFRDVGWVWEGQGFDPGVPPSIYGLGEGADYFGLDRCIMIFHPTNAITLGKLADKAEVVVDISKWKLVEIPRDGVQGGVGYKNWRDSNPVTAMEEAELLSRLSVDFPNVTGGFNDDTSCMLNYGEYEENMPRRVREALRSANPDLNLWIVVYSQQLGEEYWRHFQDVVDVVTLWVGDPTMLANLAEYVDRCAEVFPGKPINVGAYLHHYGKAEPVPLPMVELQWETMLGLWEEGRIDGYNILGSVCIDRDPEQAEFIREFIAAHGAT